MKTRTGFVSNSSSSSFIISFDKDPSNIEDLAEMLGECGHENNYHNLTTEQVVSIVHTDVMNQMPASAHELMDELSSDFSWELYLEFDKKRSLYTRPDGTYDYDAYDADKDAAMSSRLAPLFEKFKLANKDKFVYILEYDDSGSYGVLEDGSCFSNVEYKKVSHH